MIDFAILKHIDGDPVAIKLSAIEAVSVRRSGGSCAQVNGYDIAIDMSLMNLMALMQSNGYSVIVDKSISKDDQFRDATEKVEESENETEN